MSVSRKDFEAIAAAINNARRVYGGQHIIELEQFLDDIVEYLGSENKNFDAELFIAACGGHPNEYKI